MMKRIISYILICLLCVSSLCIMASCGFFEAKNTIDKEVKTIQAYQMEPESNLRRVGGPYTDGESNYFYYKVGVVKNVPVYYDNGEYYQGTTHQYYEWSETATSIQSYTDTVSKSISYAISTNQEMSVSSEASSNMSLSYAGIGAGVTAKVASEMGVSSGVTNTYSAQKSHVEQTENIVTTSKTKRIEYTSNSPIGHYRYIVYANFDLYLVLICNIEEQTISYEYLSIPRSNSYFSAFNYSEDSEVPTGPKEKFEISDQMLKEINEDFFTKDGISIWSNDLTGDSYSTQNHSVKYSGDTAGISFSLEHDYAILSQLGYKLKFKITSSVVCVDACKANMKLTMNGNAIGTSKEYSFEDDKSYTMVLEIDNIKYDPQLGKQEFRLSYNAMDNQNAFGGLFEGGNEYIVKDISFSYEFYK